MEINALKSEFGDLFSYGSIFCVGCENSVKATLASNCTNATLQFWFHNGRYPTRGANFDTKPIEFDLKSLLHISFTEKSTIYWLWAAASPFGSRLVPLFLIAFASFVPTERSIFVPKTNAIYSPRYF
jgi:hypothetical protein